MRILQRSFFVPMICLLLFASGNTAAQSDDVKVVGMTGDKDAVWIATSDNRLIYCWWPNDPKRMDKQANCRVLDRFRVDRLQ